MKSSSLGRNWVALSSSVSRILIRIFVFDSFGRCSGGREPDCAPDRSDALFVGRILYLGGPSWRPGVDWAGTSRWSIAWPSCGWWAPARCHWVEGHYEKWASLRCGGPVGWGPDADRFTREWCVVEVCGKSSNQIRLVLWAMVVSLVLTWAAKLSISSLSLSLSKQWRVIRDQSSCTRLYFLAHLNLDFTSKEYENFYITYDLSKSKMYISPFLSLK